MTVAACFIMLISLKGGRRNLWSYASGEKYSGVWVRQLQNILITAVIDTEARLCELMNPKGAPLMWAGLWLSDWCKAMSEADGISEIADFGIGRPSSITFDLSPQTDGLITSRKGFWWDPKNKKIKKTGAFTWWRNGFSGEHAASWTSVFQCRRPSNGFLHCGVD